MRRTLLISTLALTALFSAAPAASAQSPDDCWLIVDLVEGKRMSTSRLVRSAVGLVEGIFSRRAAQNFVEMCMRDMASQYMPAYICETPVMSCYIPPTHRGTACYCNTYRGPAYGFAR